MRTIKVDDGKNDGEYLITREIEIESDMNNNVGYIRFQPIKEKQVVKTIATEDEDILIDIDKDGKLVGIELMNFTLRFKI